MDLLVVHDGARRTAERLAEAGLADGAVVVVKAVEAVTGEDVQTAARLLVGCRVDVRVPWGGVRSHRMARWLEALPSLEGKPAAAFCVYRFFPVLFSDAVARTAETLNALRSGLEAKGARVIGTHAYQRGRIADEALALVHRVVHTG